MRTPFRRFLAARVFDAAARRLGADPRDTEPGRVIGLVEPVPLLLIHGDADTTVPLADGQRLVSLAGPGAEALGRRGRRSQPGACHGGAGL